MVTGMSDLPTIPILIALGSDKEPELCRMRNTMPEPGRYDSNRIRSISAADLMPKYFEEDGHKFPAAEFVKTYTWEKVLVTEGTTQFYAWKNLEKNIIVL